MPIYIRNSTRKGKRYVAVFDRKQIHFGSSEHSNYTIHRDADRKQRYIDRHAKRENWRDPNTAGFWSRWILWNGPTLKQSIDDVRKRFRLDVIDET